MARWIDRWAARAQRKSDEREARWQERQRERARSGQMTAADRWMARAQRRSDERAARWQELEPLRQLVTAAPINGPGDSAAVISIDQSGPRWLSPLNPDSPIGPAGPADLLRLLIAEAIWLVVFRRSYTVHVRTNDHPPIKIYVRLPSEKAAYHAAAQLVSRFQDDGPAALQGWRAETSASTHTASRLPPAGCGFFLGHASHRYADRELLFPESSTQIRGFPSRRIPLPRLSAPPPSRHRRAMCAGRQENVKATGAERRALSGLAGSLMALNIPCVGRASGAPLTLETCQPSGPDGEG